MGQNFATEMAKFWEMGPFKLKPPFCILLNGFICITWEDHFLKPSTCPHTAEIGALREAAHNNIYALFQKKRNFNLSIFPTAPESLTLALMMYNARFIGIHSSPKERQLKKVAFLLEESVCMTKRHHPWFIWQNYIPLQNELYKLSRLWPVFQYFVFISLVMK